MMRYHALPIALLYQRGNILTQMDVSDMRKYESADVWKMAVKLVFVHDACFQLITMLIPTNMQTIVKSKIKQRQNTANLDLDRLFIYPFA